MLLLHTSCIYSPLIRHYPGKYMCKLLSLVGFPHEHVQRAFVAAAFCLQLSGRSGKWAFGPVGYFQDCWGFGRTIAIPRENRWDISGNIMGGQYCVLLGFTSGLWGGRATRIFLEPYSTLHQVVLCGMSEWRPEKAPRLSGAFRRWQTFPQGAPAPTHLLGLHPPLVLFWTCPEHHPAGCVPPRQD